eukprot:1639490-Rhodomonas_salina.1
MPPGFLAHNAVDGGDTQAMRLPLTAWVPRRVVSVGHQAAEAGKEVGCRREGSCGHLFEPELCALQQLWRADRTLAHALQQHQQAQRRS